ncbi:hypothetical protein [Vibrio sp. D431a]|uniref:hypothetical protein n=1 Tax=Vibrio sp. D431a TaxID=2837388 RepID=UPI002555C08C|nr:hypothetical protein [Vibrio sp. D431a]MDK9789789.1 hypothetical protein [Vibrio sp. D431a]
MDFTSLDSYELLQEAFWDVLMNGEEEKALTTYLENHEVDGVRSTDWDNFRICDLAKVINKLPADKQEVHKKKFERMGVDLDAHADSIFSIEDHKTDRILGDFDIKLLRTQKWYRGSSNALEDHTVGLEGSAVYITNSIEQALSYAGEDGFIAEVELPDDFKALRHSPSYGRVQFSPITYDNEAKLIAHKSIGIVARDVIDDGPFRELGNGTRSVNVALKPINELKLVSVKPSAEYLNKPKLEAKAKAKAAPAMRM